MSHDHTHHHGHHHGHHHAFHDMTGRRLLWASIINITFTLIQTVGGILANSLSLLSDALHNLADSVAIFIAYAAHRVSRKKPNARKTFGYHRFEILAAFVNAIVLIAICLFLFVEAYRRFVDPQPIKGLLMLIVATAGLLANVASVFILHRDKKHNLNVRAAYLHLMGDTLSSVAVIIGGLFIWLWNIVWIDPLITVLVGIYIIWQTWGLLRESTDILMQGTPPGIDIDRVQGVIERHPEVKNSHHIHLWRLTDKQLHMEAHITLQQNLSVAEATSLRESIVSALHKELDIAHSTLQIEYGGCTDDACRNTNCL